MTDTSRWLKRVGGITVYQDGTSYICVKEFDPVDEGGSKTHTTENVEEEVPVDTIKSFFLVQRENGHKHVGFRSKEGYITKEREVFANEMPRDSTSLVRCHNRMNDLQEVTG